MSLLDLPKPPYQPPRDNSNNNRHRIFRRSHSLLGRVHFKHYRVNQHKIVTFCTYTILREETRGVTSGPQGQTVLFRIAREDAVRQICEKLKQKLNEFLELESYDWLLVEPQGHASSFISDLIAFLQTTFQSFTNLPVSVTDP